MLDLFLKDFHHQSLVGLARVFKVEWHHLVIVGAKVDDKCGVDLLLWLHMNLVIA